MGLELTLKEEVCNRGGTASSILLSSVIVLLLECLCFHILFLSLFSFLVAPLESLLAELDSSTALTGDPDTWWSDCKQLKTHL